MTDDLNIHRWYVPKNEAERLDTSHDGFMKLKQVTEVECGDFIVTPHCCGLVGQIDSFGSDGYNGLLRLLTSVGGVICSRFDYIGVIERPEQVR